MNEIIITVRRPNLTFGQAQLANPNDHEIGIEATGIKTPENFKRLIEIISQLQGLFKEELIKA